MTVDRVGEHGRGVRRKDPGDDLLRLGQFAAGDLLRAAAGRFADGIAHRAPLVDGHHLESTLFIGQ